jgi:hypothetical protein
MMMKNIILKNKNFWQQKDFRSSVFFGGFLIILSLILNHLAGIYINNSNVNSVHDILLDNLPVVNIGFVVNEGVWLYIILMLLSAFRLPHKIPFGLKGIAIFVLIRSIFISLTHLGPAPMHSFLNPTDWLSSAASGNDMFFSGHTGLPFLLALVFWDDKFGRIVSVAASLILGFSMLLGHLHYSIDIFAAFFITYTIFEIAKKIFPKDYKFMNNQS